MNYFRGRCKYFGKVRNSTQNPDMPKEQYAYECSVHLFLLFAFQETAAECNVGIGQHAKLSVV